MKKAVHSARRPSREALPQVGAPALTASVQRLILQGDTQRAASTLLDAYGPELYGFLVAVIDDRRATRQAYARVCERLAYELASERGCSAARVLLYALAHQELARLGVSEEEPTPKPPMVSSFARMAAPYRSITFPSLIPLLQESLTRDERQLIVLKFARRLSWHEIARVYLGRSATDTRITAMVEHLRRRLARVRERVRRAVGRHVLSR